MDVIVSDQRMPEHDRRRIPAHRARPYPDTVRMVLSGYTELQTITDAINQGAIYRFLTKPWNDDELRSTSRKPWRTARWRTRTAC